MVVDMYIFFFLFCYTEDLQGFYFAIQLQLILSVVLSLAPQQCYSYFGYHGTCNMKNFRDFGFFSDINQTFTMAQNPCLLNAFRF